METSGEWAMGPGGPIFLGSQTPSQSRRDSKEGRSRRDSKEGSPGNFSNPRSTRSPSRGGASDRSEQSKSACSIARDFMGDPSQLFQRCWGHVILPCYAIGTELENLRTKFALTGEKTTGKRRGSFGIAAKDATQVFKQEVGNEDTLRADEVLRLNGMEDLTKHARIHRLLGCFDDNFQQNAGIDLEHFKEMHYKMNKTCQVFMREGDMDAAKGELLMLYTVVEMQQEKLRHIEEELLSKQAMDNACAKTIKHMDEIERAASGARHLLRQAQSKSKAESKSSGVGLRNRRPAAAAEPEPVATEEDEDSD